MKDSYVCGFLMDYRMDRFITIDKGSSITKGTKMFKLKSCGVGGKIINRLQQSLPYDGSSETPHQAMEREFLEETGYTLAKKHWHCFLVKEYNAAKIYMFVAFTSPQELYQVLAKAKEIGEPEGQLTINDFIDLYFDPSNFTHDIPSMLTFVRYEMLKGLFAKLDPEGLNSADKN